MPHASSPPPVNPELPLRSRTIELVRKFDGEVRNAEFNASGTGTEYAEWFADLLEEWVVL